MLIVDYGDVISVFIDESTIFNLSEIWLINLKESKVYLNNLENKILIEIFDKSI